MENPEASRNRLLRKTKSQLVDEVTSLLGRIAQLEEVEGQVMVRVEWMRELLESLPDSTLICDAGGIISMVNKQAETVFGYSREELVGQPVEILVPDEFRDGHGDLFRKFATSPAFRPMGSGLDLVGQRKSGEVFPVSISLSPIETSTGFHIAASVRDITERKQAEQALMESEQRLRVILRDSPIGVGIASEQGELYFANSRFTESYGLSPDDPKSRKLQSIYADPAAARALYRRFQNQDPIQNVEMKLRRSDGSIGWSLVSLSPIEYKNKSAVLFWSFDITKRKHAEDALAESYALTTSSIKYASRIQRSILPGEDHLNEFFSDFMVVWQPRDVVGGDMYWIRPEKSGCMVAVLDCTGHGVPGALMTTIAVSALDRAFQETGDPARLIARVNQWVKTALRQEGMTGESDDGLELGVCLVETERRRLTFAGARFELMIANDGEIETVSGDRSGLGYRRVDMDQKFTNHSMSLRPGMSFYMTSDGMVDQIGGNNRRAFGKRRIRELLAEHSYRPMAEQREHILAAFDGYQGQEMRRDDVTLVGFTPSFYGQGLARK